MLPMLRCWPYVTLFQNWRRNSEEGHIAWLRGTGNGKDGVEILKTPRRRRRPILENNVQCALKIFSRKF
jgi:hypothetical protein